VRKLYDTPLILIGDMWHGLVDWASLNMVSNGAGLAGARDMQIPVVVDSIEDAVQLIREHHANWLEVGKALDPVSVQPA
jgi:hypothetical protein